MRLSNLLLGLFESEAVRRQLDWFISGRGEDDKIADLAGIHRTYVGDVERGERNLSLLNMVRLSAALGVRLSQVILEMERHLSHKA